MVIQAHQRCAKTASKNVKPVTAVALLEGIEQLLDATQDEHYEDADDGHFLAKWIDKRVYECAYRKVESLIDSHLVQ